ncbi:MAG TPA: di-trans,poly-cis-decaprenylcistransferase [Thermoplasmatales archaeon]|nr:di-trans,poly-cis-decaprenylcistransferase [Thermoplasmatales archaeon]
MKKFIESSPVYTRVREELKDFKERRLKERVLSNPLPHHVAIIMDGNRRYAKNLGLSEEEAYSRGKEKLEEVLEWCLELGIKILTVYAFSTENFKRSRKELDILFRLFKQAMEDTCHDERIHKNGVRVNVMGKLELLPEDIRDAAKKLMEKTRNYKNYVLNIALAYGGRQEIVDAIREIARKVREGKINPEDVDERTVSSHLYTKDVPDPDLILRTSGEERISNFLLWQLAYSELYFADVYWPAFKKEDFLRAILTYQQRKRRYGR